MRCWLVTFSRLVVRFFCVVLEIRGVLWWAVIISIFSVCVLFVFSC